MRYILSRVVDGAPPSRSKGRSWGSSQSVRKRGVFMLSGASSSARAPGVRTDLRRPSNGLALVPNEKPWRLNTGTTFLEGSLNCYRLIRRSSVRSPQHL